MIPPGQNFTVINPNGQTLYMNSTDVNKVTPQQDAVQNQATTSVTNIAVEGSNLGAKVVTVGMLLPDILLRDSMWQGIASDQVAQF